MMNQLSIKLYSATKQNWQKDISDQEPLDLIKQKGNKATKQLRCYICDSPNHLARQCKQTKTESTGKKET